MLPWREPPQHVPKVTVPACNLRHLSRLEEETEPAFHHYPDADIPAVDVDGVALRVMMASAYGVTSSVKTFAETLYVEAKCRKASAWNFRTPKSAPWPLRRAHSRQGTRTFLNIRWRQIKIADKICNVRDVGSKPPKDWPLERRCEYLAWAEQVVNACRGASPRLEQRFDDVLAEGKTRLRV